MEKTSNGKATSPIERMLPHHYERLRNRALSDETIRAAGFYSETDHVKLATMLSRRSYPRKCGPAIVLPYDGAFVRVRPDQALIIQGKPAKYLSPVGAGLRVYMPPILNGELREVGRTLIITEGEFKALAIAQTGYASVGLGGVDCWHSRKSSALLLELEALPWKGRKVYLAFDSDAADNQNVADNEKLLSATLGNRGAVVKIIRIPPAPDGAKQGADDYIAAQGVDAFHKLVDAAEEPQPVKPEEVKSAAKCLLPEKEAEAIIAKGKQDGVNTLAFWRDAVWHYQHGAYREVADAELRARITVWLNERAFAVGQRAVGDIVAQVRAQSLVPFDTEPPAWLGGKGPWPASEVFVAKNGIVHLPSLAACSADAIAPPTPRLFCTNALPYAVEVNAPPPERWHAFLRQLWPDDDCREALQQWFGYCLTPDTSQQKIMLVVGPKRSGKGTIARVLTAMLGAWNVAGPTLASLSTNFGLQPLVGKSLAVISDARLSGRTDQAAVTERLLSISGEDCLTVDQKFRAPVTAKLPTRIMILSNELPRLTDTSGALASRMIILPLGTSFYGREDRTLTDKLLAELPGILLWAVAGWSQLREQGRFTVPACSQDLVDELDELTSPVRTFITERCLLSPEFRAYTDDLFAEWRKWCDDHGRHPGTREVFARDLRAAVPAIRGVRPRDGEDRRYGYYGIAIRGGF